MPFSQYAKNGLSMDTSAYFQPLTVKLLCDLNSFVKSVAENSRSDVRRGIDKITLVLEFEIFLICFYIFKAYPYV